MRVLSAAHDINSNQLSNPSFKRATSFPRQCSDSCRNAQLECQRNPLSPALCGPGSNFLQQYNQCQSCIEKNSNNPEPIKASLAMRFNKCTAYCNKLQASISAPSSATQTEIPTAGQDGDPFTITTTKTSSTSSTAAIQTIITTSSLNVDYKGETTIVTSTSSTSTLPATTTNPPTLPTTSTSAPQQSSFTLPSSSSSLLPSTSTSLTTATILDTTTTTTTQTQTSSSLTSPTNTDTSLINPTLLPLQPSADTTYTNTNTSTNTSTKTAPWVWVIVGITITVVFLLSSGSFFFFYKRGRSKRERRQRGMKGMVELKETMMVGNSGFGEGWGSDAACFRTGTGTRAGIPLGMRRVPDEAGGPGSNVMPELEGSGSGGGWGGGRRRGVGGIITKGNGNNVPPVEMPSCGNGFAELPTEFNRRKEELVK